MSRHALITGAGSGIGEVISRQLHAEGYRVSLVGRRIEPLQTLSTSLGSGSQAVAGDVTDRAGMVECFATAREHLGDIDILVNCAGMAPTAPFHRLDFTDWQRTMDVNVNGVFHCTQIALENMLDAGWGRIINITSVWGKIAKEYRGSYGTSKFALDGMTAALAAEVAEYGILANSVAPGFIETDLTRRVLGEDGMRELAATVPARRLGQPGEVGEKERGSLQHLQ